MGLEERKQTFLKIKSNFLRLLMQLELCEYHLLVEYLECLLDRYRNNPLQLHGEFSSRFFHLT